MVDEDEWIVVRGVLGFQKPQARQARESPSCLLHRLALLPLGGEMGQSPLASPLISSLRKAFSCQGKPSEEGREVLCGLMVLLLLKQVSQQWGHLPGGDYKKRVMQAFLPRGLPLPAP